jgi:SPX domain
MKFGKNLPRNQVPEYANVYINYRGLKKIIGTEAAKAEQADLAGACVLDHACGKLIKIQASFILWIATLKMFPTSTIKSSRTFLAASDCSRIATGALPKLCRSWMQRKIRT